MSPVSGSRPLTRLACGPGQIPQTSRLYPASLQLRYGQLGMNFGMHLNGFFSQSEQFRAPLAAHRIDYTAALPSRRKFFLYEETTRLRIAGSRDESPSGRISCGWKHSVWRIPTRLALPTLPYLGSAASRLTVTAANSDDRVPDTPVP